jgi:hypothetical protein
MKYYLIILFLIFFTVAIKSQGEAYCNEYYKDCQKAKEFFSEHESQFEAAAKTSGLSSKFLFSIVAPEISQYSYLSNKVETYSLKVFYVQKGSTYANFSIGIFQMQPSFIESMENYIIADKCLKVKFAKFLFEKPNKRQTRVERIKRLNDVEWQIDYLALFCVIINHKFADTTFTTEENKLHFYANAYNSGFHRTEEALKSVKGSYFPHFSKQKYKYSDIAVWFYQDE